MNLFRTPSKRNCAFIYMDSLDEIYDRSIKELNQLYDVYVYFNSSTNMYVGRYCSLLPVTGFIEGKKGEAEGLWELTKCVYNGNNRYFVYFYPIVGAYRFKDDHLENMMAANLLESSIIHVQNKPYSSMRSVYEMSKWDRFKFWKKYDKTGTHSTHYTLSPMIILYSDINKLIDVLNDDYVGTFRKEYIFTLIPSAFSQFKLKFLDTSIECLKSDLPNADVKPSKP